jgi:hypothetical protein
MPSDPQRDRGSSQGNLLPRGRVLCVVRKTEDSRAIFSSGPPAMSNSRGFSTEFERWQGLDHSPCESVLGIPANAIPVQRRGAAPGPGSSAVIVVAIRRMYSMFIRDSSVCEPHFSRMIKRSSVGRHPRDALASYKTAHSSHCHPVNSSPTTHPCSKRTALY